MTQSTNIKELHWYIINEHHRIDRRNNIKRQMDYIGIDKNHYHFFKAVGKTDNRVKKDYRYSVDNNKTSFINKIGTIGLIHSTIDLFKKINETTTDNYVVILEDDAFFHRNFMSKVNTINFNKNANFIFLAYIMLNNQSVNKYYNLPHNLIDIKNHNDMFYGTYAFICDRNYRNKVIEKGASWFIHNNLPVDDAINVLNKTDDMATFIIGGEQLVTHNVYDENCLNPNLNYNTFYTDKRIDIKRYYRFTEDACGYKKRDMFSLMPVKRPLASLFNL